MTLAPPTRGEAIVPSLTRCTGDPQRFLADAWGRRAAVCSSADPRGFKDMLALDDVDRFVTTMALRTPFFRLVRAGERIAEAQYTRGGRAGSRDVNGIVDAAAVASQFEQGATIVLQAMHRWSEPVARFCRSLELELGHACQVNAYVTPAGAQGLDLHHDPHDVFVLQAFGTKRWQVHAAPAESDRPALDVQVRPGDTVYMPSGTPHAASAQQTVSGHLTVGVHVTTWADLAGSAWADAAADPSLGGPLPAGWIHDLDAVADDLSARVRAAAERLAATDAHEVLHRRADRFLSSRAQLGRGWIAERAEGLELSDDSVVWRRRDSVCELRSDRGGDAIVALLGDRRLRLPGWLEPAMRRIAAAERIRVGDLDDVVPDPGSRAVLVRRLVREGLLSTQADAS